MKFHFTKSLLMATALLPTTVFAQQQTRELKHIKGIENDVREAVVRTPQHSSYHTQLVGFVYYAESWNDPEMEKTPMGIYTAEAVPGAQPQPFARIGYMNSHCNGGAVLADDTFYYIWRQTDPSGETDIDISQLYSYNLTTGEFQNRGMVDSSLASSSDHAWDPTEDKIYGQYSGNLCIVDYKEQTLTAIGSCDNYYGLAFDSKGQLWGINGSGDLYKIDKKTAAATKVGSTGVTPSYDQSMAFDLKTDELYWTSYTGGSAQECSKLYKVDISDASATLITTFSDAEEFMGLGVIPSDIADDAPGAPADMSLKVEGTSVSGTLTFTLPSYTYMGSPLSGDISYKILAGDTETSSGTGAPGATVTEELTLPMGEITVTAVCSNIAGEGPGASVTRWIGEDYPLAPANVKLAIDEASGKATVSWDNVTEGVHGLKLNPENISYSVTRLPDNITVNTENNSYEETLDCPDIPVDYRYEVKALNGRRESEASVSNHVPYGKGYNVPYYCFFDNAASMNVFRVIDGNNDGSSWKWDSHRTQTAYIFTGSDCATPQDDWLITPGISMKSGNRYEVKYTVCANMNNGKFFDTMEVGFGLGSTPENYTIAEKEFVSFGKTEEHTFIVAPEEDGYYHLGFHATSPCKTGLSIAIDDLFIDVLANEEAPAKVTDVSFKTSKGTAPVTIKFTTPTTRVNGQPLDKISKIEVFRNTTDLVKSVEMTETGQPVTIVDNTGASGMTTYAIVAYNEAGVGERYSQDIYLGQDLPGACGNITARDAGNGQITLTWEAPVNGANGGYFDPNNLSYNIYEVTSGSGVLIKESVTETAYTFVDSYYYSNKQGIRVFAVAAVNSYGVGPAYTSSEVVVGNPYKYPYAESWKNGEPQYDLWYYMNNGNAGWYPVANYASDNDGGCMTFEADRDGDLSYIALGKVDFLSAKQPKLIFDYYAIPGADMYIQPEINLAFTGEYAKPAAIDFKGLDGDTGWREAVIDLASFLGNYEYLCVRFLGKGSTSHPLRIDNVRFMDSDKTPTSGFSGVSDITVASPVTKAYYDLNGMRVVNPRKGDVLIERGSDGSVNKVVY